MSKSVKIAVLAVIVSLLGSVVGYLALERHEKIEQKAHEAEYKKSILNN